MTPNCNPLQQNFAWCEGTPSYPGIRRRLYYCSKSLISAWPKLPMDENGRVIGNVLEGSFVLKADAVWKVIDVIVDKSGVTSDPQGEAPSQTQLNKLTAVLPGVDENASKAAAVFNNADHAFIIQDAPGKYRLIGSERYQSKVTVAQDLGQGATGSTATTLNVEATDVTTPPFYTGEIVTDEGTINEAEDHA